MQQPQDFLKAVRKRQIDLNVSDKELRRVVGWSERTQRRRYINPDEIKLGEAVRLATYLDMKGE